MPKAASVATGPSLAPRPRPTARTRPGTAVTRFSRDSRRTTAPWGSLGTAFLIVAIKCALACRWLDLTDPVSLSWRYRARRTHPGA